MRLIFLIGVSLAAVARASGSAPEGGDYVSFGSERLLFPNEYAIVNRADQARLAALFNGAVPTKGGRPFRAGVELVYKEFPFGPCFLVHMNDVYDRLSGANVGFFIDKIQAEQDFRAMISRVGGQSDEWLSPEQLRHVLDRAENAPRGLPIRVLKKDFHAEVLAKGCFRSGDAWAAAYVYVGRGGDVGEAWTAIDRKNRVVDRYFSLVEGASPMLLAALSGAGAYSGPVPVNGLWFQPGEPRAVKLYQDTGRYVAGLIAEAKARFKK